MGCLQIKPVNFSARSDMALVFYNCGFTMESSEASSEDVAVVQLSEDDQGLAAGQFAAFYQGKTCLGSGIILESWDDQGFPVCENVKTLSRLRKWKISRSLENQLR